MMHVCWATAHFLRHFMHLRRMRLGAGLLAVCPGLDLASRQGDGPALVSVCGALGCGVLGFGWVIGL